MELVLDSPILIISLNGVFYIFFKDFYQDFRQYIFKGFYYDFRQYIFKGFCYDFRRYIF